MKKTILLFSFIFLMVIQLSAQIQIKGTVTGAEDGLTIPGVSVTVKGNSSIGTTTDIDGKYSLTVPENTEAIVFSFIGMKTLETAINGQSTINIEMELDMLGLEEVVVLGYQKKGKNEVTGSAVQIDSKSIQDIPLVSADQALQGKVAGLSISATSGTPGSTQNIRIRGRGSISAGNEPLYVIDGVPMISDNFANDAFGEDGGSSSFSSLSAINPNDIESMTVLKDASATSPYGARGSNGVIVITTKSGKRGDTKFNFTSTYGFQNEAGNGGQSLTAAQQEELFIEAMYYDYGKPAGISEEETYQYLVDNWPDLWVKKYRIWNEAGRKETNWTDAVARKNAPVANINLSASGGDDRSTFYASLGYNKTDAIVLHSAYERISGVLNYTKNLRENIKFSTNNNVSTSTQNSISEQSAYYANPYAVRKFAPSVAPVYKDYADEGEYNFDMRSSYQNPLYISENNDAINNLLRGISNSTLEWELIENLTYKTQFNMDYSMANRKTYRNRYHGDGKENNADASERIIRNFNYVAQNSLSYKLNLDESHHFDVMLLMEYQKNEKKFLSAYGESFPADGLKNLDNTAKDFEVGSASYNWANLSYLGMINYNYQAKYIVDLTYRREGSSRFAPGNRFGNFWAVGLAWNVMQEDFMSNLEYINSLRLRTSYGTSGNSSISLNGYQALYGFDSRYNEMGTAYPYQLGNDDLTWEKNKNFDIGVEFGVFNDRISGSFSYFHKTTFDLIQEVPISRTVGFFDYNQNIGEVVNKGVEALLNFEIIKTKDFNVGLSMNIATLNNEVTKLAKDANGEDINIEYARTKTEVGHPIYAWNMREWAGVDSETGLPQWYTEDGSITNNYNEANKRWLGGSALPTYTGGVSPHIDYKGISLDATFAFSGGNKVFEGWSFYTHHSGLWTNLYTNGSPYMMNRWQEPGDITDVPITTADSKGNDASSASSRFLYDGDYIRLRDITLSYNIPENICRKIKINGIRLFVKGTNMWTWTKDDRLGDFDPEVPADGVIDLNTPPVKSYIFGINLNF